MRASTGNPTFLGARWYLLRGVVVENKAGAGGTIAMTELARSAPDAHTIEAFFTNASMP
jgi:tripartite-type tricarboxylate transporter receptor subunit TctC